MEEERITEPYIVNRVIDYLIHKPRGNWHEDKVKACALHEKGVDIKLVGGKRNSERFLIECKGKSYAKSANSVNENAWVYSLGQIVTRMNTSRVCKNGDINRAYKYGLGLYWKSARKALKRIPKEIAKVLNFHIFSCYEDGTIVKFTPSQFNKEYTEEDFKSSKVQVP